MQFRISCWSQPCHTPTSPQHGQWSWSPLAPLAPDHPHPHARHMTSQLCYEALAAESAYPPNHMWLDWHHQSKCSLDLPHAFPLSSVHRVSFRVGYSDHLLICTLLLDYQIHVCGIRACLILNRWCLKWSVSRPRFAGIEPYHLRRNCCLVVKCKRHICHFSSLFLRVLVISTQNSPFKLGY